jgi:hypothetical protein
MGPSFTENALGQTGPRALSVHQLPKTHAVHSQCAQFFFLFYSIYFECFCNFSKKNLKKNDWWAAGVLSPRVGVPRRRRSHGRDRSRKLCAPLKLSYDQYPTHQSGPHPLPLRLHSRARSGLLRCVLRCRPVPERESLLGMMLDNGGSRASPPQ